MSGKSTSQSSAGFPPTSGNLPRGWTMTPVGEVVVKKVEQEEPAGVDTFNYIDIGSVDNVGKVITEAKRLPIAAAPSRARQKVTAADVLVSMTRPNLNAVAVVPAHLEGATASTGFDVLRPTDAVLTDWLFLHVRSQRFVGAMTAAVQGALYPAVRPLDIRNFLISLPPLAEQRRIVARLEALEARSRRAREKLAEVPTQLAQARQSLLAAAFRGDLTADWQGDKQSDWSRTPLAKLVSKMGSGATPRGGRESYHSDGVPLIRSMNVRFEGFSAEGLAFLDNEQADALKSVAVAPNDVLFNITGASIGRVCLAPNEMNGARVNQHVMRIRPTDDLISGFLASFLASPEMQNFVFQNETGTTRQALTKKQLEEFQIPLPPLAEQHEIVRRLTAAFAKLDAATTAQTAAVATLDRLDQSLLTRAFAGKLVPQSEDDEPVATLLNRLAKATLDQPANAKLNRPRKATRPKLHKPRSAMPKSRHDPDVKGQRYLAKILQETEGSLDAEKLFKRSQLPLADFYKQLGWEVAKGYIGDSRKKLEATT